MENHIGLLRIRVIRGIHLAVRDFRSSDPYVVVRFGKQKLKTRVIKKCLDPEWNEELTLLVTGENKHLPIRLVVYDRDLLSLDDRMGDSEMDIGPLLEAVKTDVSGFHDGVTIRKIGVNGNNCLAEESRIRWVGERVVQHMFLRLRNVECGEIELELKLIPSKFY